MAITTPAPCTGGVFFLYQLVHLLMCTQTHLATCTVWWLWGFIFVVIVINYLYGVVWRVLQVYVCLCSIHWIAMVSTPPVS